MEVRIHPHAEQRLAERGAKLDEVIETVLTGEKFPAKFERTGFRKNFLFEQKWNNKFYANKQIEAYCVQENNYWLVITILVKYF